MLTVRGRKRLTGDIVYTEGGEVEVVHMVEVDGIRNEFKGENRNGIITQYSGRQLIVIV